MVSVDLPQLVSRIAARDSGRSEADLTSDIRALLLYGGLNLHSTDVEDVSVRLESAASMRRRIDIEIGTTVIEVKKDLRPESVRDDAVTQLAGYVADRSTVTGQPYTGIITDGVEWRALHLSEGVLRQVGNTFIIDVRRPDGAAAGLCSWLESVLSTQASVRPSPNEIERRLGVNSPSYDLDRAALWDIWESSRTNSEVQVKRQLWARLVATALGTQFPDTDELFVQHTYLVISAGLIAHELLGIDVTESGRSVEALLRGSEFSDSQVNNVVEAGFFDWVLDNPKGYGFVRRLARRIHRFAWSDVEHDILKVLYESVIDEEQRKQLGEFYTPDWLAAAVVESSMTDPASMRIHDPSCGSGTFLFHAVRKYLASAEASGVPAGVAAMNVTRYISGIDIHPVAVVLARVTYLLAIGADRLSSPNRGSITIPVYLGDSLQWTESSDLLAVDDVVVPTKVGSSAYEQELRFPRQLLADAGRFDELVAELAVRATSRTADPQAPRPNIDPVLDRFKVPMNDRSTLIETFGHMCHLHDVGRNGIWGFYVRNLVRPAWLSQESQQVDLLIGNPPWLGYRFMTPAMQQAFKARAAGYGIWTGGNNATQMDLSAMFVIRACELYLRRDGKFAFVMPRSVLSREQYAGFRKGNWPLEAGDELRARFDEPWDLFRVRPHFFPYPGSVIFGSAARADSFAAREDTHMPHTMESWVGRIVEVRRTSWDAVRGVVERAQLPRAEVGNYRSHPYFDSFSNGATLYPRVLISVGEAAGGLLGAGAGRVRIESARSVNEKKPWKSVPSLRGTIERDFLHRYYTGNTLLPYRLTEPGRAVIPWDKESQELLDGDHSRIDLYPGLAQWWREAERLWETHKETKSKNLSLRERLDYQRTLSVQFPPAAHRVVYNKSGLHLFASYLSDPDAVVDNGLYWAGVESEDEAYFLCGILNSDVVEDLVTPLMSSSKDERDFAKSVFAVPWAKYCPDDSLHSCIVELARNAADAASEVDVSNLYFVRARQNVTAHLEQNGIAGNINALVTELLEREAPTEA
ncbi:N-6 DNA methylase [Streptomyces sp. ID05-47C]|uniref:N-6 DNA methylase n=1 Tax=Streptomyces sp. ID05-47C TaxID=3028665 RepID=UPI0029B64494|nr:N-6 DNA methylase [Streptomyces sp. ID05-47C]MDX3567844.1 N-6 DNA methylase [Streptomyces sp. ID05-47C]